jgi:hypothetical protein
MNRPPKATPPNVRQRSSPSTKRYRLCQRIGKHLRGQREVEAVLADIAPLLLDPPRDAHPAALPVWRENAMCQMND